MDRPAVSTMTTQRIDRLLRSLVGVADVRMLWRAHTLRAVHILRDAGTQPHQLIRNVVSGLQAGFGINMLPTQVHVHDDVQLFDAVDVAADVLTDADPAEPKTPANNGASPANGNGKPHANGNGNGAAKTSANGAGNAVRNGGAAGSNGSTVGSYGNGESHGNGGSHANGGSRANGGCHANGGSQAKGESRANGGSRRESGQVGRGGDGEGANARDASALPRPRAHEPAKPAMIARPSSLPADVVAAAAELVARRQHDDATAGLTLERIDVERRSGMLRCRTVLALGEQKYSAIAEVPDSPSAEAELAARVAVDALRAGGLTDAMLEGVGFITIANTNYCVASLRETGSAHPRASAAPLIDSMAASATAAVLTALGSFTDARARSRARAGH